MQAVCIVSMLAVFTFIVNIHDLSSDDVATSSGLPVMESYK